MSSKLNCSPCHLKIECVEKSFFLLPNQNLSSLRLKLLLLVRHCSLWYSIPPQPSHRPDIQSLRLIWVGRNLEDHFIWKHAFNSVCNFRASWVKNNFEWWDRFPSEIFIWHQAELSVPKSSHLGKEKNTTPSERAFKIMFLINFKRKYVVISCLPLRVQLHYSAFAFTKTPVASTSKNYELISCGWRYPIMMARLLFACSPFQFLYRTLVFMSTDGLKTVPPSNLGLLGRSHGPADSKSKGPSVK